MKKKNGFTLIELLAVIVILAIIALIAVPTVLGIINDANKSAFEDSAYGIIKSGELFYTNTILNTEEIVEDKVFIFPNDSGSLQLKGSIPTGGTMVIDKDGKIEMAITNGKYCVTKSKFSDKIKITKDTEDCFIPVSVSDIILKETILGVTRKLTNTIDAKIEPDNASNKKLTWSSQDESIATVNDGIITGIQEGTTTITVSTTDGSNISKIFQVIVESEPIMTSTNKCLIKGNTCSEEEINAGILTSVQVNDETNYTFYVINDTENEVTLIMNKNLGGQVRWYSSDTNTKGPISAITALEQLTSEWKNLPELIIDKYENDAGVIKNLETPFTMYARLPNYNEILAIKESNIDITPKYLYENLYTSSNTSTAKGYWLSTASSTASHEAWSVNYNGNLIRNYTNGGNTFNPKCGVRPVIVLPKKYVIG